MEAQMATKKTAKKKTAKKKTQNRSTDADTNNPPIEIYCGCLGSCVANPSPVHLSPGDQVVMHATNADVKVTFTGTSPFVSNAVKFTILKGTAHPIETIKPTINPTPPKKFKYSLACSNPRCRADEDDAEMIVP
jgi:hypothetical protein